MRKNRKIDIKNLEAKLKDRFGDQKFKETLEEAKVWFEQRSLKEFKIGDFTINYKRDSKAAVNTAITAKWEEKSKEYICPRIPKWMGPDHLTAIGLLGNVIVAFGFVLGFFYPNCLILVVLGLIINWFGDSFDGSIARYRKKTRPNYGYYIDKIMDSFALMILGLGLGLSGYVKIEIALIFVCMYFILMFHVDLVTHVQNTTQNSFGLVGPTEVRIIGIAIAIYMYFAETFYINVLGHFVTQYDIAVLGLSGIMFIIAVVSVLRKGIELHKLDTADW